MVEKKAENTDKKRNHRIYRGVIMIRWARLLAHFAVVLTMNACGNSRELGFQSVDSSKERALKEGVNTDDGTIGVGSEGDGAFDGQNDLGVGNDSDGWVREDGGEGGSGVTVPGQVENGGGGGGGGFGDFVGDLVGDLLPDPNLLKCQNSAMYRNAATHCVGSRHVSMYNNLIGVYLSQRWRKLAPGKLVLFRSLFMYR